MTKTPWPTAVCAALICVAAPAWGDPRVEARRHFKTGMALIADGHYEEGITELMAAYAMRPHANVLFNVAKAYEGLGQYPEAISYYRRYLDTNPSDASEVSEALERLEAKVAPPPRAAEPKRDRPNLEDGPPKRLPEAPVERPTERPIPPAPMPAPVAVPAPPPPADEPEVDRFTAPYEETVVAASRRAQSTLDAPNSITVITGDEIRASGLQSLPEILRRVPGAEVMTLDASSTDVSFRGFNQRNSNKVLLLIDGRPEYQDFLAVTLWQALPIGVDEIDRVEVIRGPGSALYGANAMLGVVNIITRSPGAGPRAEFSASGGNGNTAAGSLVVSGGDRLFYRASAGYTQGNKYSRDYADNRADVRGVSFDPNLGLRSLRGNATLFFPINHNFSVAVSGGVNRLYSEFFGSGLLRNLFVDGLFGYAKADVTLGPVRVRAFWNTSAASAAPQYEPIGPRSLAMTLAADVLDGEVFFHQDFELLGSHMLSAGISGRLKRIRWTYLSAVQQEFHAAAFVQEEWRIVKMLALVASFRVDRHPLLADGYPGYAQSPRVSIVLNPVEEHAFRAAFATAFRAPSFGESYMDLRTPVPGVNGASVLTQGNQRVYPERLLSFEIGYRGELARRGVSWDVAGYWNIVSNLIYLSDVVPTPVDRAYDPASGSYLIGYTRYVNDATTYTARGAEIGATVNAAPGLDVRLAGALQFVSSSAGATALCGPCTQAPTGKMHAGLTYRSAFGLDVAADFSYVTSTTWIEREPNAETLMHIVPKQYALSGYAVLNARVGYRLLKDRVTLSVVGSQLGPDHQEHPFGNLVTRRIFGLVTVQP